MNVLMVVFVAAFGYMLVFDPPSDLDSSPSQITPDMQTAKDSIFYFLIVQTGLLLCSFRLSTRRNTWLWKNINRVLWVLLFSSSVVGI